MQKLQIYLEAIHFLHLFFLYKYGQVSARGG